ncbi:MAG: iron-sulfur cluster assembly scaffold protein [Herpetosiphon sp.]
MPFVGTVVDNKILHIPFEALTMDRQEQVEFILDHYQAPRHNGKLEPADVTMPGGNPGCGDVITIYLNVDRATDRIKDVRFEGEGCTISQAAASILLEKMAEQPLSEVDALDYNDMIDELGRDVVSSRPRCATLALGTLKAAVKKYRIDRRRESGDMSEIESAPTEFQV